MIPDKVYLQEGLSVPVVGFVSPSWNNPKDKENTVEYIRKNALLEWINKARTIPHENAIARDLAFQEVVNKLNEM